jgi:hypothetical protein
MPLDRRRAPVVRPPRPVHRTGARGPYGVADGAWLIIQGRYRTMTEGLERMSSLEQYRRVWPGVDIFAK